MGEGTEVLRQFFARLQNYAESLVCTQVLFEGLGVDLFQVEIDQGPYPLLQSIFERVRRDEARHTAFGSLYLDHLVPKLSHAERHTFPKALGDVDERVRRWDLRLNF